MEIANPMSEVMKPRRWLRWLKRVGCGLLMVLILAVSAWVWRHHSAQQHLNEALAELDHTDPGWRLEDMEAARAEVPEGENSARVVVAAARQLPRSWRPEDLSEDYFWFQPPNEMLSGEDFGLLSDELASMTSALEIADKLANMPRGRHRPRYTLNAVFPKFPADQLKSRRIATLLIYESMQWNQSGNSKKALTACRAALNAVRSLGDEPSQVSQLIRCAGIEHVCWSIERTLGQGEPPPQDMAALQKRIEDEDVFPDQLHAARGQRAAEHRVFEGVERGKASVADLTTRQLSWLERTIPSLWHMDTREDHALFLSLMTRRIQEAQQPMHEQAALENEFEQIIHGLPKKAFLTRLLLPSWSPVGEKFRRKHAHLRCTIVALATERFRQANKVWPASMDQLCPQYLAAVLLDPFDGKPLRYRRVPDGVVIYSVDQNGVDNGGELDREHANQPGANVGFRLWDVSQRRQPPRPKPPAPKPG